MWTLSNIGSSRSMSPCPQENMLLANVFASSCPTRWGGTALATERILGTFNVRPAASAWRSRLGLLAGVAEDVLRDTLALAARPVDRRPALSVRDVPEPVDGHQLQVVGNLQQPLQPLPVLGYLHRRRDELDAHTKLNCG